MKFMVIEI